MAHAIFLSMVLAAGGQSPVPWWVWLAAIAAIFYFLIYRPQQRERVLRREMLANLKKNDRVMFGHGLLGVVTAVREAEVTVRVDEARDVKIHVSRSSISAVLPPPSEKDE